MEMPIHRPVAQRNFEVTPASTPSTHPSSPTPENTNPELLMDRSADGLSSPSRNRSILNLTTSTLFGIYSGTTSESGREELSTPWGTGAQTPAPRTSIDGSRPGEPTWDWNSQITKPTIRPRRRRTGIRRYYLPLALQTTLLAGFGVAFGAIIAHLQESRSITPVPVLVIDNKPTYYHLSWALFGILLGNALPILDELWAENTVQEPNQPHSHHRSTSSVSDSSQPSESSLGPLWYSAVRSIGAFVGIAFAVRKLHWQSTLQLSMTLALANPVLWYLIDRSIPGFAFSAIVGLAGTIILLLVNPNFVPVPAIHQIAASEQVGVFTWLLSILFCTSLCFGAIGRKLHL